MRAVNQARPGNPLDLHRCYTVEPGRSLADQWLAASDGSYDLSVYGPNGFLRAFRGSLAGFDKAIITAEVQEDAADCGVLLTVTNHGQFSVRLAIADGYTDAKAIRPLAPGETHQLRVPLIELSGWYDFTLSAEQDPGFVCKLAGHVETGRHGITDPAIGLAGCRRSCHRSFAPIPATDATARTGTAA